MMSPPTIETTPTKTEASVDSNQLQENPKLGVETATISDEATDAATTTTASSCQPASTADTDTNANADRPITSTTSGMHDAEWHQIMSHAYDPTATTTMSVALLVYWIIPVLLLAMFSRLGVDTTVPSIWIPPNERASSSSSRPITVGFDPQGMEHDDDDDDVNYDKAEPTLLQKSRQKPTVTKKSATSPSSSSMQKALPPTPLPSSWPTAYRQVVETIHSRRRRNVPVYGDEDMGYYFSPMEGDRESNPSKKKKETDSSWSTSSPTSSETSTSSRILEHRGAASDPVRIQFNQKIVDLRAQYHALSEGTGDLLLTAIHFAEAMRVYDIRYHDGGSYQKEAIQVYDHIVEMALKQRQKLIDANDPYRPTDLALTGTRSVPDEITLDYSAKSSDGLLCAIYTSQSKLYFMANMFERALERASQCIDGIHPLYLDAVNSRASAYIILGRYQEAAADFWTVIQHDSNRFFIDAFSGLARVLEADESALPEGWDPVVEVVEQLIPKFETNMASHPQAKNAIAPVLNKLHHTMFMYHDKKTKDYDEAFDHLQKAYQYKLSVLPPWDSGHEMTKIRQTKSIFTSGFWPPGVGSPTIVPIFIIGFVRSGSTLLERVLDAHPAIVGTGENSVFNGRLDDIRNQIVRASVSGQPGMLSELTYRLAEEVVDEMRRRWQDLEESEDQNENRHSQNAERLEPQRFVDKMLTNYYNVGFIHMLYPNALILHVAREPMDTVFSAYKHEFPSGTLDYTSSFQSLAELYNAYRDLMDHWDRVLPGRVMHVRYDDMVHDMPGVARAIIAATGLAWDDSVLEFHKKKHAVNTLSTTQVRKGVYKDGLKSWMRYEKNLQPLQGLLGKRLEYDLATSLPGYQHRRTVVDNKDEL